MKRLWTQQSRCGFHDPQCHEPLVDETSGVVTGEVCHIRSAKSGGPRFDSDYKSHDEFENLILMCPAHHKVIDSPYGVGKYTAAVIENWKRLSKASTEQGFELSDAQVDAIASRIAGFSSVEPVTEVENDLIAEPDLRGETGVVAESSDPSGAAVTEPSWLEKVYWLVGIAAAVVATAAALSTGRDDPVVASSGEIAATSSPSGTTGPATTGLSRSNCDPQAWAAAAEAFIAANGLETTWIDPDQDCLTTSHEVNRSGTPADNGDVDGDGVLDGVDPDQVPGGLIPLLAEQLQD